MRFKETTALHKILKMKSRTRIVQGGTSAGKTIAILTILIDTAQSTKGKTISVVSESFPHLRKGAIKDFVDIMQDRGYYKDDRWNKSESTYTFETGSKIEFFSADQPGKVHGPRRNILFVNEANNISFEVYRQLALRTSDYIFIDYNPVSEFYVHTDLIPNVEHDFVIITYLDNECLPETVVREIESYKNNKNFWQVYGLGQLGEAEGRIYTGWTIVDDIPAYARLDKYGLDFGYTNDPTAILALYVMDGGYLLDEVLYRKGMSNKDIADVLLANPPALVIADSAEPKSIDEISSYGVKIVGTNKGRDSVVHGIQYVQQQKIFVTKRSVNLLKEYRNYLWLTDKEGKTLNEPQDFMNHLLDALRYAMVIKKPTMQMPTSVGGVKPLYTGWVG